MLMFDPNSVRKKVKMILALKKCPYFKNVSLNVTNYLNVVFHVTDIKLRIQITYWVTHKLPQIYTANHATFPIQIRKITVQTCGNFWVTQYHHSGRQSMNEQYQMRSPENIKYFAQIPIKELGKHAFHVEIS